MPDETIRELIMQEIQRRYQAMSPPDYWFRYALVEREAINPMTEKRYPHISVMEDEEENTAGATVGAVSLVDAACPLVIAAAGRFETERATRGNRMLYDLEAGLMGLDTQQVAGALVRVSITGKTFPITAVEAPLTLCGLSAIIQFRYVEGDPTRAS